MSESLLACSHAWVAVDAIPCAPARGVGLGSLGTPALPPRCGKSPFQFPRIMWTKYTNRFFKPLKHSGVRPNGRLRGASKWPPGALKDSALAVSTFARQRGDLDGVGDSSRVPGSSAGRKPYGRCKGMRRPWAASHETRQTSVCD